MKQYIQNKYIANWYKFILIDVFATLLMLPGVAFLVPYKEKVSDSLVYDYLCIANWLFGFVTAIAISKKTFFKELSNWKDS